jgi:hypothetical protein
MKKYIRNIFVVAFLCFGAWSFGAEIVLTQNFNLQSSVYTKILEHSESQWLKIPHDVVGFTMRFDGQPPAHIEINSQMKSGKNIVAEDLPYDVDTYPGEENIYTHMFLTSGTQKIQWVFSGDFIPDGELVWMHKKPNHQKNISLPLPSVIAANKLSIVTRKSWGANESLRYFRDGSVPQETKSTAKIDTEFVKKYSNELELTKVVSEENGKKLIWPYAYPKSVDKIIIHHSAGRTPACHEEEEVLRAIYTVHTVNRGWGDIGYNYIVGPCTGKVYEGRAGELGAIGAHAWRYNTGSLGVMMMGNFSESDVFPAEHALNSVANVVRYLGEKFGIDPTGKSVFRGEEYPNVFGHRDVANTNCPGDHLHDRLDDIRNRAKQHFDTPASFYGQEYKGEKKSLTGIRDVAFSADPFSANTNHLFVPSGTDVEVTLMFRNVGTLPWDSNTFIKVDGDTKGIRFGEANNPNNIAKMNEGVVESGNLGTFTVQMTPNTSRALAQYRFQIVPVINGETPDYQGVIDYTMAVKNQSLSKPASSSSSSQAVIQRSISQSFDDVATSNVFYPFVETLKQHNIVRGQEGVFSPTAPVLRQEFAKMVSLGANLRPGSETYTYRDVPTDNPFYTFVRNLRSNGITSSQTAYRPNDLITRAEGMKIVVNSFNFQGTSDHSFSDTKGSVFDPYLKVAVSNSVVERKNQFYPDDILTREQAAKFIAIAMARQNPEVSTYLDYLQNSAPTTTTQSKSAAPKNAAVVTRVSDPKYGPNIRTQVGFESSEIKIGSSDESYDVVVDSVKQFQTVPAGYITTVSYGNGKYLIKNLLFEFASASAPRFISTDQENGVLKLTNWVRPANVYGGRQDIRFRDTLEIRYDAEVKTLYAINELPLEKYLWGLAEQPNGMPIEKNRTIAVLARSYAYYYSVVEPQGKHPNRKSHLISNGNDQVYRGYDYEIEHDQFKQNVKDTWGEVVKYDGAVIKAPYFSISNGRTKQAGSDGNNWRFEVFPYTQSVSDPWSCGGSSADLDKGLVCHDNAWGHGVGLSAKGAEGMAREGKLHKEIIEYFFRDVEVVKVY